MSDGVDGLFKEMFSVTNIGGADFVHASSARALLKEVVESRKGLDAERATVAAWKRHAQHLSAGKSGQEKTIGWAFFDPRQHCSICKEGR